MTLCHDCSTALREDNTSLLMNGASVHIGCPARLTRTRHTLRTASGEHLAEVPVGDLFALLAVTDAYENADTKLMDAIRERILSLRGNGIDSIQFDVNVRPYLYMRCKHGVLGCAGEGVHTAHVYPSLTVVTPPMDVAFDLPPLDVFELPPL